MTDTKKASELGMWVFIISESFFFSGLFLAYIAYSISYPQSFHAGSAKLNLTLGTINTAILLTSSFTMALSAHYAVQNRRNWFRLFAVCTILLACSFLAVKGVEYRQEFTDNLFPGPNFQPQEPRSLQLFFILYFLMTGFHALHIIGASHLSRGRRQKPGAMRAKLTSLNSVLFTGTL